DLIVHPCADEGFGIVYVEAMALERTVIAAAGGAAMEIVDDGETGLLVPPHQPAAFARAILDALADPSRLSAIGREARRRAQSRYAYPVMVQRYERFYDDTVGQVPSPAAEAA